MRVLVVGAGEQGRIVASNLASRPGWEVTLADLRPPAGPLPANVRPIALDARDAGAVRAAAQGADAAVSLLPATIGTVALPALLDAGVPTVDVSFTTELPFHLDAEAKRAGVPLVVDFGVAPGLSHVLAAALHRELHGLDALRILVGGMPLDPPPIFRHAVYFHARDLVDEYIRPARLRAGGVDRAGHPLDEPVGRWKDEEAGDLEAFPSDGLRSLLASFPSVPDMIEATLRVPGHLAAMRTLRGLGMLESRTAGATAEALGWAFPGAAHPDRLLLEVQGERRGASAAYRLHALREGPASGMARATAFSAAAAVALLADGAFDAPGVHAPERLGADGAIVDRLLADLEARGLRVERKSRLVPAP